MNKSITGRNSKEVAIQLKRAKVQKDILIKNIYKEYEVYFHIVRKSLLNSVEKGILGIYADLSISDKGLNSSEINIFLNKNISLLIHSKLPLITIEQLKLGDISYSQKQIININHLKDLDKLKEYQTFNYDYKNELIDNEPLEFHCNNNSNTYEYYESLIEDECLSFDFDKSSNLNSFSKRISLDKIDDEKYIVDSVLELIEETNNNNFNDNEKINDKLSDVFISSDNLNFFEFIDKSFSKFLLELSYKVNSELFKVNLIKKNLSEDLFKSILNNNYIIKYPLPFIIRYDLSSSSVALNYKNSSNIYLFNITNVELEFSNLDLSICRNNINELKNKFKLLNKKLRYWKHKEHILAKNN